MKKRQDEIASGKRGNGQAVDRSLHQVVRLCAFYTYPHKGWCALSQNNVDPHNSMNVKTICGCVICFPMGISAREPTCPDCLRKLRKSNNSSASTDAYQPPRS